jgi:hypothetical protein
MPHNTHPITNPLLGITTKSVHGLLEDIRLVSEQNYEIVEAVRALVRKTFETSSEEVKCGDFRFTSGVQFGGVSAYGAHVTVEFGSGAKITDTVAFLEGREKGASPRQVDVRRSNQGQKVG